MLAIVTNGSKVEVLTTTTGANATGRNIGG